ncbi:MAG: transporter [Microbacteriaceae bacterium]|nr:transporter [Microbacteriaceae bacterium]
MTATEAPSKPFGWRFTSPLLLGSTLNPINTSMLATALVGIGVDFHAGPGTTASLVSILYLFSAVSQPTMGKLSTVFGPRRIFLIGVGILLVAGFIGALAPSFAFLLVSRALIGVGTAAAFPTAMSLVRRRADSLGTGVPTRVLGNFSIAAQVTAVVGLPLGGLLTGAFGWRALFAVNIPLAIISIVLTFVGVAKDEPIPKEGRERLLVSLDIPGIALFAGTITSLLFFLGDLKHPFWWLLALTVLVGVALVLWERRATRPMIDVRMLARRKPLQRTYIRQILISLGTYAMLYGVSQWMEQSRGLSASVVGLVLIPLSVLSIIVARFVSGRGWIRWPLVLSGAALIGAAAVGVFITDQSPIWVLIGMSLLVGLTSGLGGFANQAALYIETPADEIAVGSGLLRTSTNVAAIFSSSIIGLSFGAIATDGGLHVLSLALAVIGIALVLLSVLDHRIPANANPG